MAENETNGTQDEAQKPEAQDAQAAEASADESKPTEQAEGNQDAKQDADTKAAEAEAQSQEQEDQQSRRRGGGGRSGQRRSDRRGKQDRGPTDNIDETVVKIYRCATVVKGGRRFSFAALVVAGDRNGRIGLGYGKANEVPNAVEKATKEARRNLIPIQLAGTTVPHEVTSKYRASRVRLVPASEGTGVIAGASVRAVMELAGVKDVLTKVYGSTSPKNLVKAAFQGLTQMRSKDSVTKLRNVELGELASAGS